jgi:uncharacterized membrane protein
VPIDFRLLERSAVADLAIARVDAPPSVGPNEAFLLTAWVRSPTAGKAICTLTRSGGEPIRRELDVVPGLNRVVFRDKAAESGNQSYSLTVESPGTTDDPVPENNAARILVGVSGPKPVLHVTPNARSGLADLLRKGGLRVVARQAERCEWTLEELSKYSSVVLENVPAEKVGDAGMKTLAAWVRETGSGLMMTGGRHAYGPGGYYKSPLEPVMPVSMELRNEHRKLSMAIVVALDRSGSMAASAGGGKAKMDLANLGTVAVVDLLGPNDEIGVIAVDSEPHTVTELHKATDKPAIRDKVLRIQSMGGGIYVYEALVAAAKMIEPAKAGTRHIILFADAADAEQPGDYKPLLEKIVGAGMTVSVVALGTEKDPDANLLKDIADRGKGRCFFTDKPEELPRLFAQDTFVVARNTFIDEPTPVRASPALPELLGRGFDLTKSVGGYNLTYLRPEARLGAQTVDEYNAPLVAAWQAGSGRVLCYTGEADGEFLGELGKWPEVGEWFSSLGRWTAGPAGGLGDGMLLTQDVRNGIAEVRLHLDPDRKADPFAGTPRASVLTATPGRPPTARKYDLRWEGLDTLSLSVPLQGTETVLATVDVPGQPPVSLPPACLPYSPEFRMPEGEPGGAVLARLARSTGGSERVDLAGLWKEMPRQARLVPAAPVLLLAAVVLLILEVLERRTGVPGRLVARILGRRPVSLVTPAAIPAARETAPVPSPRPATRPSEALSPRANPAPSGGVLAAIKQARERSRGRVD